jgi:hypothetical protein
MAQTRKDQGRASDVIRSKASGETGGSIEDR